MKFLLHLFVAFLIYTLLAPFVIAIRILVEIIAIPTTLIGGYVAIYTEVKRRLAQWEIFF